MAHVLQHGLYFCDTCAVYCVNDSCACHQEAPEPVMTEAMEAHTGIDPDQEQTEVQAVSSEGTAVYDELAAGGPPLIVVEVSDSDSAVAGEQ